MYKLLIFDWDGTVIDSTTRIASCLRSAARDLELPIPTWEAAKDIIGLGLPEAIAKLFPGRVTTSSIPYVNDTATITWVPTRRLPYFSPVCSKRWRA